ncbi:universal stress protein [Hephaestia mangrovi]|uniref:universal stress protein n=1 Tax=Hephaestia mangrovi TaxID=2873268 RepID=UPI001CA6CE8F|nr:universal stress protein [Hephaestia mangrovi]MBY8826547.1 universal stress protein [Hephaestia mangrovi]
MIADIFAILDLGSTDATFVSQAKRFADAREARLRIGVAAPVHALETSLALAGGYALPTDLERCAGEKEAEIVAGLTGEGIPVSVGTFEGEPAVLDRALVAQARVADLTLVGPPAAYADRAFRRRLLENLALHSGRPVLALPESGIPDHPATVVLAWNGSREAARALNDVLALVDRRTYFDVVEVCDDADRHDLDAVCAHLQARGHGAAGHHLAGKGEPTDHLLAFAHRQRADLLAVGAYGRTRLSEMLLGGVTRDLIAGATMPVLFSH